MRLQGLALGFVLLTGASAAQASEPSDPLQADGCVSAMAALHEVEATLIAAPPASSSRARDPQTLTRLAEFRRAAARTCRGAGNEDLPPPRRSGRPPIAEPAVGAQVRPVASPPGARATPAPAAVALPPLKSVTSCDALGCWASDGSRLQKLGPNLVGPSGVCSVQGTVLSCP